MAGKRGSLLKGVFEWAHEGTLPDREEWVSARTAGGASVEATGAQQGESPRAWSLAARFGTALEVESLELQVRPPSHPSEVTTLAFRCFGGRAFGTLIPPGGVPEKFETAFPAGSAMRGFSTAFEGLSAMWGQPKPGHGRRLLVVDLDTPDLRPRVRDALLLTRARKRAPTPEGEQWCFAFEFRWAQAPGLNAASLLVTKQGLVLRAEHARGAATLRAELSAFAP